MVETPVRRSRRIKSQSDDEASVSSVRSRGSRGSRASNTSPASTPTRRSSRRSTRGASAKTTIMNELEAIPETIVAVVDADATAVVAKTPAKSAKKSKKKVASKDDPKVEVQDEVKEAKGKSPESEDVTSLPAAPASSKKDATNDGDGAPGTPSKSAKKKSESAKKVETADANVAGPKTPPKSVKKKKNVKELVVAAAGSADDVVIATTPPKSSRKKPKKAAVEDATAAEGADDVVIATTPPKSSRKKSKKAAVEDAIADGGVADVSTKATPPKSNKKKQKKAAVEETIADGGAADVIIATTPPKSSRKKQKKAEAEDATAAEGDADLNTKATPPKSNKKKSKKAAVEEIIADGGADDVVISTTPPKSSKKKSKKAAVEDAAAVEGAADVSTKATPSKSTRKKRQTKKNTPEHVPKEPSKEALESTDHTHSSTPSKSAKKSRRKSANQLAAQVEVNALVTDSKAAEQGSGEDPKAEVTEELAIKSPPAPSPFKNSKRKKRTKRSNDAQVDDAPSSTADKASAATTSPGDAVPLSGQSSPGKTSKISRKAKNRKTLKLGEIKVHPQPIDTITESKGKKPRKKRKQGSEESKGDMTEPLSSAAGDAAPPPSEEKDPVPTEEVIKEASTEDATCSSVPAASSGISKKKKGKRNRMASEATAAKSDANQPSRTNNDASAEAPKKKKRKKRKANANPDANVSSKAKDDDDLSETPKKRRKKSKAKPVDSEVIVDSDAAKATTADEDVASKTSSKAKKRDKRKAEPKDPEVTVNSDSAKAHETKDATSKISPKKGGKDKSSSKKAPHKEQRSHKHGKPTVSPSPKWKINPNKQPSQAVVTQPTESPKLVMDVNVHRLRFLKLHPKSIIAMSSTPFLEDTSSPVRLAISREGGTVELVSPQDRWVNVGNVPGVRGREVDALVWVRGKQEKGDNEKVRSGMVESTLGSQRSNLKQQADEQMHLFGCSRDGTIFELDFATKCQKGVIGSGGGGVFCMTSMCSRGNAGSCGGYFAAGCEDGTVKIYTAFGSNGLGMPELVATLPGAGNAILSLAWVPGQSGNDDGGMGGSVIFAGVADGTIRRFDCVTSVTAGPISTGTVLASSRGSASFSYRWKSTLRMTVENRGLRESTNVWALQALSDGTVISGDSLGHVQIWDGMSGTMTQTFDHNESGADVLCLAVSKDENKVFASGIDSSVRCYQRQSSPTTNVADDASSPSRKWISSNSHRKHSHDVKALAICHKETGGSSGSNPKVLELLVSGSVDTRICTYPTHDYKSSRPKIWYNWPTLSPIAVSRKHRLLSVTREDGIDLYRLNGPKMVGDKNMIPETMDETKSLVKKIAIQSPFNLCCSVISDDGRFLAASDAASLYIFSLEVEKEVDGVIVDVRPVKLSLSGECKHPATALRFDDSGRLICATKNGPINILRMSALSKTDDSLKASPPQVSLEHVFKEHTVDWSAASHHFPVVCLDVSPDGKWLAAGRFSSGKGAVHVFALPTSNEEGSGCGRYQHWWSVPEMDAPTTCIKFLGGVGGASRNSAVEVESSLAVGCSNNEFYIYNLERRSLSHWSNDMGLPLKKSLPRELTSRSEPVARIISNPVSPQRFILGSHGYFCVVDLDQPVPERSSMFPSDHLRAKGLQQLLKEDHDMDCPLPPKKNLRTINAGNTNFTVCLRYCEILFQDFVGENEMVIVEEPWMNILEELPDALERRVYGT